MNMCVYKYKYIYIYIYTHIYISCVHQGKKQWIHRNLNQTYLLVLEGYQVEMREVDKWRRVEPGTALQVCRQADILSAPGDRMPGSDKQVHC